MTRRSVAELARRFRRCCRTQAGGPSGSLDHLQDQRSPPARPRLAQLSAERAIFASSSALVSDHGLVSPISGAERASAPDKRMSDDRPNTAAKSRQLTACSPALALPRSGGGSQPNTLRPLIGMRIVQLLGDQLVDRRAGRVPLQRARLVVQPPDRRQLLVAAELGVLRPPTS